MYFEPMKKTELPNFYKRTKNRNQIYLVRTDA